MDNRRGVGIGSLARSLGRPPVSGTSQRATCPGKRSRQPRALSACSTLISTSGGLSSARFAVLARLLWSTSFVSARDCFRSAIVWIFLATRGSFVSTCLGYRLVLCFTWSSRSRPPWLCVDRVAWDGLYRSRHDHCLWARSGTFSGMGLLCPRVRQRSVSAWAGPATLPSCGRGCQCRLVMLLGRRPWVLPWPACS